ncbi:glycosyltransferase [Blastococcus haudaquaticus]|nr:glycosyltransferase [Blastococcus haudaquaticus]
MLPYAGAIASRIARLLFPIIAGQYSRIAFATREAQENYELLGLPSRVERTTIWPIPTRCDCLGALEKQPEVLFLSTLEPHKGIDLMFELWRSSEQVRGAYGYKLRVVGKGGLEERVVNLAAEIGDVIVEIDPPRARVHELLRRAKIVLLLSQPHRYWKEQVGLSLTEGLAHGCTIIATGETGLAPWLADHGHAIVDASSPPSKLAETLRARCETPVDPHAVLSSLSGIDGRLVADRWMANGIIVGN